MTRHRVKPGTRVRLREADADDTGGYKNEDAVAARTDRLRHQLGALQERLYAENKRALLIVLQAMDTGGKDGTIRHVMSGVNPQSCTVTSFKVPTPLERAHDFLWRAHAACPPHGYIGIFNRSHYEDVLVTRVHGSLGDKEARRRMAQIRDFEEMLTGNGTRILKFFLHISKEEQKQRLLDRLDHPEKRWKFSEGDIEERGRWKDYRQAFEEAISATSTRSAPWFVVPANHKWYRNLVVADRLVHALEEMDPQPPAIDGLDWKALRKKVAAT